MSDQNIKEEQGVAMVRVVTVDGRPTAVRMEPVFWDAMTEICRRERQDPHELVSLIDAGRGTIKLSAAMRVFTILYFRTLNASASPAPGFAEDPPGPSVQLRAALDALGPPRRPTAGR